MLGDIHRTPTTTTIFPAHWFPKSVKKMCLEQTLSILAFGEGGCHLPAPRPRWKGACVVFYNTSDPPDLVSQVEGRAGPDFSQRKRGMLFNHHPSPQAGVLLVKDAKAGLLLSQKPSAAVAGVGTWF